MPLEILEVHFELAESGGLARALVATALSLWRRARFRTWLSLFVAGARETSCLGGPKTTFRDRRKGSERFYFQIQLQIPWHVQYFGHGGDLGGALVS